MDEADSWTKSFRPFGKDGVTGIYLFAINAVPEVALRRNGEKTHIWSH